MGISHTRPSAAFCSKTIPEVDIHFTNMDPTIILKLHSIITEIDIFQLSQKYDYHVKKDGQKIISMDIPKDMVKRLKGLANIEIENVLNKWRNSEEVKLSAWSKSKTEVYLHSLISSCRKNVEEIHIIMHINEKPNLSA